MSNDPSIPGAPPFAPPVSSYGGPVAGLIAQRMLSPPGRPGVMASLNQYEVQRVLGGGGMGVVLLARDAGAKRSVAIKLIKPELVADQRVVHRFVKEAGHLQRLKHPNVVPVLEISDRPEGPFFVMPYFERGSLAGCIRPGRPLDAVFILDISAQIAAGLQFAHRRGIIHRDLKPANILRASESEACLADFGLARTLFNDSIVDVERQQCEGTAPYMSPGVAAGDAEDTRCDIYSFGALLYEMLTGEPPYTGATLAEIRKQILAGPPKPVKERNPGADDGLVAVAEGAMARQLRDRYADMTDVVADLQRIKEGKTPVGPRGLVRGGLRQVRRISPLAWIATGMMAAAALSWTFLYPAAPPKNRVPPDNKASVANTSPNPTTPSPAMTPVLTSQSNLVKAPTQAVPSLPPPSASTTLVSNPKPPGPALPPRTVPTAVSATASRTAIVFAGQAGVGGSADGVGAAARFLAPGGVAVDTQGNLYVADTGNNTIRKITPDGVVTTLAGLAGTRGNTDSTGAAARFWGPFGIAVDSSGNILVAEAANCEIRRVTPQGLVSTLAGLAGDPGANNGIGDNAQFRNPWAVAVGRAGTVYVADTCNFTIRSIATTGVVSVLAGEPGVAGGGDGAGASARFSYPHGVATDRDGDVYVADTGNNTIRLITPAGVTVTLAGQAGSPGYTDGPAIVSHFRSPQGLAVDAGRNVYVADTDNLAVRVITSGGDVKTLVINGDVGHPDAIAVGPDGSLYLADTVNNVIRKLIPVRIEAAR